MMSTVTAVLHSRTAGVNPLVPTYGEVAVLLVFVVLIALLVAAVVSLSRDEHYSPAHRLLWLLVLLAAPVAGPILWLAVGRNRVLDRLER